LVLHWWALIVALIVALRRTVLLRRVTAAVALLRVLRALLVVSLV